MSEPKRVPLQTLEFPDSLGHAAKKDKEKQLLPSHRFTLTLPESNEKTCPEFNYAQLLKAAEKKRAKEHKKKDEPASNGLDPYDDDDEDKLKEMAKKFEAKYGNTPTGKKINKLSGYADLGAGYDENDSFIDNTDAYDEIVPDEVTTAHGGFYINCGALEFTSANNNNININVDNNDDDESSEESEEEDDTPKRIDKRVISSSSDDDEEDISTDHPPKKQKVDEPAEKKPSNESVIRKKKKPNHQSEEPQQNHSPPANRETETLKKNSESIVEEAENENHAVDSDEKKKQVKLNDVSRTKSVNEKKFDMKKFEKKVTSNGYDSKKVEVKKLVDVEKDSKIDDAIESVVNASRVDVEESSRDSTDSAKSRACGTESDCEELDKQECPMPDCLPESVKEICNNLKVMARTATGKSKFFTHDVNGLLFALESQLRLKCANPIRLQTYQHLAHYLPCTKTTLVGRVKKLHLQHHERRVETQLEKLKAAIDRVMPIAEEKYRNECQRIVDQKDFESPTKDPLAIKSEEDESLIKPTLKVARKKFPWNEDIIEIVREMASSRRQYYKILRPRKEKVDNFVSNFLESEVLPLWPVGWMKLQVLLKYAATNPSPKKKQKKRENLGLSSKAVIIASGSVNNCQKPETAVNNVPILGSDKGKPSSNSYKVNSSENSLNLTITKSSDSSNEKKQISSKHKERNLSGSQQHENATPNVPIGKITVVPTAQLLAKPSTINHADKFNPMDLTSTGSLSITPVDFQIPSVIKPTDVKKDTVSITPYTDPTLKETNISQSLYLPRQEIPSSITNQNSAVMVSMPMRVLQEAAIETNSERKSEISELDFYKGENKREHYSDGKLKSLESKKRKRMNKSDTEQEHRQIMDETVAATNYLSQIINDDSPEKRKDPIGLEDPLSAIPVNDEEKNVQMVMRSIQQLQEVMNNSPSNSPVGSSASKSIKNEIQFASLGGLYSKNDDKYRISKEDDW